jgi:hypothetical protein
LGKGADSQCVQACQGDAQATHAFGKETSCDFHDVLFCALGFDLRTGATEFAVELSDDFDRSTVRWVAVGFFVLVAIWTLDNAFGARKGARFDQRPGVVRTLWDAYLYVAMFLPMSWYYFAGGIRALFGVYGDFHRTPKGEDEHRTIMPRINSMLLAGELFTFSYSLLAVLLALQRGIVS